jgi:hypothetical protein
MVDRYVALYERALSRAAGDAPDAAGAGAIETGTMNDHLSTNQMAARAE